MNKTAKRILDVIRGSVVHHSVLFGSAYKVNSNAIWATMGIPSSMPTATAFLSGGAAIGLINKNAVATQYSGSGSTVYVIAQESIADNAYSNGFLLGYSYIY